MKPEAYERMVELFGGDNLAARAAGALYRNDIKGIEVLDALLTSLGEDGLRERLQEVRHFGTESTDRAFMGLAEYRKNPDASAGPRVLRGALPDGFTRRLRRTVEHYEANGGEPFPEVQSWKGDPEGLTCEDLYALAKLFQY
jgi:hypothetical protein